MTKARDLASAIPAPSTVNATELGYLDGVTSAIQTQIDSKIGSASAINPTIVDAKGDIIAATAADTVARLAVGANGTVLTAASGQATGLSWATPAGGATLLSTTTFGSGGFSITGISQAHKRLIVIIEGVNVSGDALLAFYLNNYASTFYYSNWFGGVFHANHQARNHLDLGTVQAFVDGGTTNNVWSITIDNYTSTTGFKPVSKIGFYQDNVQALNSVYAFGTYNSTSPITQIDMEGAGHTYSAGTVRLFGV